MDPLGEQAVDAGTLDLTITGGEPLVRSDFPEIYTAFTEMGFRIHLQTNLSLLDGALMDLIAERPPMQINLRYMALQMKHMKKSAG